MTIINFEDKSTTGFDDDALTTSTSGERLINFGNLTTTGDKANGILPAQTMYRFAISQT